MLVQAGLCRTCSETTLLVFPRGGSNSEQLSNYSKHYFLVSYYIDLNVSLKFLNRDTNSKACGVLLVDNLRKMLNVKLDTYNFNLQNMY